MAKLGKAIAAHFAAAGVNDDAKFLMSAIAENLRAADAQMKHRMLWIVGLCGCMELVRQAGVSKVSVSGIEFANVHLILIGMPVIVAYLYFSFIATVWTATELQRVYNTIFESIFPELYTSDLDIYTRPLIDLKVFGIVNSMTEKRFATILGVAGLSILLPFVIVTPVSRNCLPIIVPIRGRKRISHGRIHDPLGSLRRARTVGGCPRSSV
jgi:hypothetical protein